MTIDRMRANVISVYPYDKWRCRVNNMPDNQVQAIYFKFKNDGKFDSKFIRERKKQEKESLKYHQMTLFEYLEEL